MRRAVADESADTGRGRDIGQDAATTGSDAPRRLALANAVKILMVLDEGERSLAELAKIFACDEVALERELGRLGWNRLVKKEGGTGAEAVFAISDSGAAMLQSWSEIWRKMRP